MSRRFSLGMSTPTMRGIFPLLAWFLETRLYLPWRCLWRGLLQITRSTPLRRMIRQLAHILLTLALTFMVLLGLGFWAVSIAVSSAQIGRVIRPLVASKGDSSTITLSPVRMRTNFIRIAPAT